MTEQTALAVIDDAEVIEAPGRSSALVMPVADPQALAHAMRQYQLTKNAILDQTDYQSPPGESKPFIKKSGWAKLAIAFGVSVEQLNRQKFYDEAGSLVGAEFEMRAIAPNGRHADGWGYCSIHEPRYTKQDGSPNLRARQKIEHDIPATARTRAVNIAYSTLFGHGEVSFEEADAGGAGPIDGHAIENPGSAYRADVPHASPYKAASANQLATVSKLSRLLGRPEDIDPDMTGAEASERITDLSREYNERKGSPTSRGNRAKSEPQSQDAPAAAEQAEAWQVRTRRAVAGALSVSREGSEQEKAFTSDVRQYMTHHYSTMNISRLSDEQLAQLVRDKFPSLIDGLSAELRGKPTGQRYTPEQLENMPDDAKQEAVRAQEQIEAGMAASAAGPTEDSMRVFRRVNRWRSEHRTRPRQAGGHDATCQ